MNMFAVLQVYERNGNSITIGKITGIPNAAFILAFQIYTNFFWCLKAVKRIFYLDIIARLIQICHTIDPTAISIFLQLSESHLAKGDYMLGFHESFDFQGIFFDQTVAIISRRHYHAVYAYYHVSFA